MGFVPYVLLELTAMLRVWKFPSIDGLVQKRRNSIANALELRLSCTTHRYDKGYILDQFICFHRHRYRKYIHMHIYM